MESEDMIIPTDELYAQYAETASSIADKEIEMANQTRLLQDLKAKLLERDNGSLGFEITDHVFKQIMERLAKIAMANSAIYNDVFYPNEPHKSLMNPPNMNAFIFNMLSVALKDKTVRPQPSKSRSTEYHYVINFSKWVVDNRVLQLTMIVENNAIKTGFFNFV